MKDILSKKGGEKEKKERRYIIWGGSAEGKRIRRRRWCSVVMATLTEGEPRHTEAFIWLSAHMTP